MRDAFLQNLTRITNLDQLEREWPYINWFRIIKRHLTFETLRPHLNKFELHRPLLREALPVISEIRLEPVCVPYLKSNLGHTWPPGLGGATILQNLYMVVGSCARSVKWESNTNFQIGRSGEIEPALVDNWTLDHLAVMVVLRNNPDQIHHLLIEIYHSKEDLEEVPITV